jgi:hypothetical protein
MDFRNIAIVAYASDAALTQHLEELIAEVRDLGATPRPLNIFHYALELGVPKAAAADLAALMERRIEIGTTA